MSEEAVQSPAAAGPVPRRSRPLEGIELNLVPDELEVALWGEETGPRSARLQPMWHAVLPRPGVLVTLRSRDDRVRTVRLEARGAGAGWNPRWGRWSYAVRWAPETLGGDALAAQDVLSEDEATLTLLVLPGEARAATLEIATVLDGETSPGDYPFDVVATDGEEGAVATAPGLLRLRHPACGLMQYLPAIYATAAEGGGPLATGEDRPFFERFLRGFEDLMEPSRALAANLFRFFDADTAPADFLPWLATWVALALDENWPVMKRRRLIEEAVELYRWRGTRRGLARYLEIYAGVMPQINDQPFAGMRLGPETRLGRNTLLGDVPPHTFVVTLAVPDPGAINEQIVRDIIESEKPAHTAYELNIVRRATGA